MAWFYDGDRNTTFFYNYVRGRRKRLYVHEIEIDQGATLQKHEYIGEEVVNYFKK